jgi:hypothetical protein
MSDPIDKDALRAEMERLKQTPDVKAYHQARAKLAGASGTGAAKARPQRKKVVDAATK